MSWRQIDTIKKLVVRFSTGASDVILTNITPPELRASDFSTIISNGDNSYDSGLIIKSTDQPTEYNQIMSLTASNVNLYDFFAQLSANQYIEIYNPKKGDSCKIRLTRISGGSFTVTFYANEQNTGTGYGHQMSYSASWPLTTCMFSFIVDETNEHYNIYWRDLYCSDASSVSYRATSSNDTVTSHTILSACVIGLLYQNTPTTDIFQIPSFSFGGAINIGQSESLPNGTCTLANPYTTSFSFEGKYRDLV